MKNLKNNLKTVRQAVKHYALVAYIMLTLMGAYSAALFYMGTQYASAASAPVHAMVTASPKK